MDPREERVAKNEATYRAANRELERVARQAGEAADDPLEVVCECGQPSCSAVVTLTIGEYDDAHRERDRFVVVPDHVDADLERVVREADGYVVVDKFGEAEDVAEAEERREGTT
jgi:hypothetical protein